MTNSHCIHHWSVHQEALWWTIQTVPRQKSFIFVQLPIKRSLSHVGLTLTTLTSSSRGCHVWWNRSWLSSGVIESRSLQRAALMYPIRMFSLMFLSECSLWCILSGCSLMYPIRMFSLMYPIRMFSLMYPIRMFSDVSYQNVLSDVSHQDVLSVVCHAMYGCHRGPFCSLPPICCHRFLQWCRLCLVHGVAALTPHTVFQYHLTMPF